MLTSDERWFWFAVGAVAVLVVRAIRHIARGAR